MRLSVSDRTISNMPVIQENFLVVKVSSAAWAAAAGDRVRFIPAVLARVASAVGALGDTNWPGRPKALIISNPHATASVYLQSINGAVGDAWAAGEGLVIPAGQSLYIGYSNQGSLLDDLTYEAAQDFAVAVLY